MISLRSLRDRLSLLQIGLAVASVALGGGIPWYSLTIFALLSLWAYTRPVPEEVNPVHQRYWTLAVFVLLVLSLTRAIFLQEFLDAGVDFLLFLVVQRLFNRQRAREHAQLVMLGALLMVVGAVINTGLNYPFLLAGYLFASIMTLLINHLMSEGERLGPRILLEIQREAPRRIRDLARAATNVAVLAGAGALIVFLVFPRFGAGVFLRGAFARETRSGFSNDVKLGDFGTIKSDATVVMHITPLTPGDFDNRLTWHLRGSSFDRYNAGQWFHSPQVQTVDMTSFGQYRVFAPGGERVVTKDPASPLGRNANLPLARPVPGFQDSKETLRARVTLEDLGVDVLFAASEPLGIKLRNRGYAEKRRTRVWGGRNREIRINKLPGPIQYEFVSRLGLPSRDELSAVGAPAVTDDLRPFVQRSESLSDEVTQLARSLTQGATTRLEKVDAIMGHLRTFRYTTTLAASERVSNGADPLEGFLFDTKAGHCEYFATAMAVLLREVGVPTRNVNGYYGAHWNDLGGFYAVRQADAHSWVEVHFGDLGWVTFDPTPPSGRTAGDQAGLWPRAGQVFDAVRNAYLEYVIDYNLSKQLALLEGVGLKRPGRRPRIDWRGVAMFAGLVAGAFLVRRLHRNRRRTAVPAEVKLYGQLLRRLERRGHPRRPEESAGAFAHRLTDEGVPEGPALQTFAREYDRMRFGAPGDTRRLGRLREAARAVVAASRT